MLFRFIFATFFVAAAALDDDSFFDNNGGSRISFCGTNNNPCLNGGGCQDKKGFGAFPALYSCDCPSRCTGYHCENCEPLPTAAPGGVCSPNPCKGDCQCNPSCKHELGYYCRSSSGYLGKNCTIPSPTLDCYSDRITVTVSELFVREYDNGLRNSFLVVQPGLSQSTSCQHLTSSNGMYQITIPMPFTTCGTVSQQMANGNVVFKNQIWFNRDLKNRRFDMPIPAIAFECAYAREYQLLTKLTPFVPTPPPIRGEFSVEPTISLCKSQACPNVCPQHLRVTEGAVYTVGEHIHVTMNLDTGSHVTTVEQMSISCSDNPTDDSNAIGFIQNGCGTLSGLPCKVTHNGASHTVCVTFQTPRGLQCSSIYIHARLSSCSASSILNCPGGARYGNKCGTSGRGRRSAEERTESIGPFYIISPSRGVPTITVYPESEFDIDVSTNEQPIVKEKLFQEEPIVKDQNLFKEPAIIDLDEPATRSSRFEIAIYIFLAAAIALLFAFAFFAYYFSRKNFNNMKK